MERWPSGLRRTPGKCVEVKASRGFESLSLRQNKKYNKINNLRNFHLLNYEILKLINLREVL